MGYIDFVVKFNPKTETKNDLKNKILYSLFIKRRKANKPTIMFIGGDSGEGKSWTVLRLNEMLYEIVGESYKNYVNVTNIYTPLQYPEKMRLLLDKKNHPEYKNAFSLNIHEARDVVRSANWRSFLNQAIADVNATSRAIKPLNIFIIAQFIRDIDPNIRYTLTYYGTVKRPIGHKPRLKFSVLWKDDHDLEKPKIRKRGLKGIILYESGVKKIYRPKYFEMSRPGKEVIEEFEKEDVESKKSIIQRKLSKLMKEMSLELGENDKKIPAMIEYYLKNPDVLNNIGKLNMKNGKWKLKKECFQMHDLNSDEAKRFEKELNENLQKKAVSEITATDDKSFDEYIGDDSNDGL